MTVPEWAADNQAVAHIAYGVKLGHSGTPKRFPGESSDSHIPDTEVALKGRSVPEPNKVM